jgi:hypothetical protein
MRKFDAVAVLAIIGVVVLGGVFSLVPPAVTPQEFSEVKGNTEIALATSVVLMMVHHEHEIEEALDEGNLTEAAEEAEEILVFIKGVHWPTPMESSVSQAETAVESLIQKAEANDLNGTKAAFEDVERTFHEVHHDLHHLLEEEHVH